MIAVHEYEFLLANMMVKDVVVVVDYVQNNAAIHWNANTAYHGREKHEWVIVGVVVHVVVTSMIRWMILV